ncbi:sulfotransferase domain-containing protein [Bacteroidota bacterium]
MASVFILSTGRAGTTFLHKLFSGYYPESNISHQVRGSRLINIIGNIPCPISIKTKLIKTLFRVYSIDIQKSTLDPLRSISIASLLQETSTEEKKIIHLVRDPKKVVSSFMNWKNESFSKFLLHYIIPFWQPYPVGLNINFFRWVFMSKFEKYCWVWYYKNTLFKQFENSPNYKLIKTEDLTKSEKIVEKIEELINFSELPVKDFNYHTLASKPINKSKSNKFPEYKNWTKKQKIIFSRICVPLMIALGYEL